MKSRTRMCITAITLFASTATLQLAAQNQPDHHKPSNYYVFNLGEPLGGNTGAVGINNLGWISGGSNLASNATVHAELWVGSQFDLGTLGGPNSNVAWPNHSTKGEIVGIAETADMNPLQEDWSCQAFFFGPDGHICFGFVWKDGVMTPLPTLGGYNSYAAGVNNQGQVVGWAENNFHDPTCVAGKEVLQFEAVIWGPDLGNVKQLPPFQSDPDSAATAINDKGEVVGISGICDVAVGEFSAQHAVLWENGTPINLGNLDGGVAWNTPTSINNRSQVAGFVNLPGDQNGALNPVAFLWTREKGMRQLPLLGDPNALAFDINEQGQVVGQSSLTNPRAFLYQDGQTTDLNSLNITPNNSLVLIVAQGVNDSGEIAGTAVDTNTNTLVGFLAVPAHDGGDGEAATAKARSESNSRTFVVPENIRRQLLQRLGLGQAGMGR